MSGIFLVEDDDRLSELMRDYLTGHGYPVTVQRDGARAVETLQHIDPAVVLLDLQLPDRDGFEVCKEIRAHYRGVIMMLTARTDDIDQVLRRLGEYLLVEQSQMPPAQLPTSIELPALSRLSSNVTTFAGSGA